MLRAVLVEEKKRKNANASKSHLGYICTIKYYCPSGKTVKASGQSCNIYDEMVLKCLIYLFNNQSII